MTTMCASVLYCVQKTEGGKPPFYYLKYCNLPSHRMDTSTKKATRKRKVADVGETEGAAIKKKTKTEVKSKVAKPKTLKSSKIKKNSDGGIQSMVDIDSSEIIPVMWDEAEVLSQTVRVPLTVAQNFIGLLTEGCTLPFIARYRKAAVDHMMPDR